MGVVEEAFKLATSGFDLKKPEIRLRADYLRRRGTHLSKINATWNAARLSDQLKAEQTIILQYLDTKKSLVAGTEAVTPAHLDLEAASKYRAKHGISDDLIDRQGKIAVDIFRSNRSSWVPQIVWRAVAIHNDLWNSLGPPPKLETPALDELLDRRLRAIEQMTCNVNAFVGLHLDTPTRNWTVRGPAGPWKDDILVRNFEYPNLPKDPFIAFLPLMTDWKEAGSIINYEPKPHGIPVLLPKEVRNQWVLKRTTGGAIWVVYKPKAGVRLTDVIGRLFGPPREDFLDRSMLYCDMVSSAIGIEALWFGLRRRHGNDDVFETIPKTAGDYVALGPVVRFDNTHDIDTLMADDADLYFENLDIDIEDVQVGDFTCFWNSRIYGALVSSGAWGNEFSYVMGIDVDAKGALRVPDIQLAGHGIYTSNYAGMASELVGIIGRLIAYFSGQIVARGASSKELKGVLPSGQTMERWEPYETFENPGAWWVRIPKSTWQGDWAYATISDVIKAVPRSVSHDIAKGGTGYTPPLDMEAVYFPFYEPKLATDADGDSWRAYLNKRKTDASFKVPAKLNLLAVDGRLAQGLFYRGAKTRIPVVRPKVRK